MTFKAFVHSQLLEGGWATTLNQDTKLTPAIVKKVVKLAEKFFVEANKYLVKQGLEEVEFMGPVGSVSYYEKDDTEQPDKEYGDIDTLVAIPRQEGTTEYKNTKNYYTAIIEFAEKCNLPFIIPVEESKTAGQFIMIKDGDAVVQVDMIFTFHHSKEWAKSRYKPEHNVKGALFGNLLSSLAEVLHFSIQGYGVQSKSKDGVQVPFRTQKADVHTVSVNPKEFIIDILKHVGGKDVKVDSDIKKYAGFSDDVKVSNIAKSIKALANAFALNDLFGKGLLKDFATKEEFLDKIADIYVTKMKKAADATKFDKVTSDLAIEKAKKVKQQFIEFSSTIAKDLRS
jgi:hypothetical protein